MTWRTSANIIVLFFLLGNCLFSDCEAGSVRGHIRGTVVDTKGTPIQDVKITIKSNKFLREIYETMTDENGRFSYIGLKPYTYKITYSKEGYQSDIHPACKIRICMWVETQVKLFTLEELRSTDESAIKRFSAACNAYKDNDFAATIALFDDAVGFNPDLKTTQEFHNILYYSEKGDIENAKAAFEEALIVNSSAVIAYEYLGALANETGDEEKAVEYWSRYFELGGNSGIIVENLSAIYLNNNELESARKVLELGAERNHKYALLYKKAGDVCLKIGDFDASLKHYRKYLKTKPDAPEKDDVINMIDALTIASQ